MKRRARSRRVRGLHTVIQWKGDDGVIVLRVRRPLRRLLKRWARAGREGRNA